MRPELTRASALAFFLYVFCYSLNIIKLVFVCYKTNFVPMLMVYPCYTETLEEKCHLRLDKY